MTSQGEPGLVTDTGELLLGPPVDTASQVELDGRIIVYAPGPREVLSLNETASAVWRLCDGTRTTDEVVAVLSGEYGVGAGDIRPDVVAVVDLLLTAGVLLTCSRSAGA